MGLRGMLYRAARNRRVWTLAVVLFLFYVNIIQIANMTRNEEEWRRFEWKQAKVARDGEENMEEEYGAGSEDDVKYDGYYYQDDEAREMNNDDGYDGGDDYDDGDGGDDYDDGDGGDDYDDGDGDDGGDGGDGGDDDDGEDYGEGDDGGEVDDTEENEEVGNHERNGESDRENINMIKKEPAEHMIKDPAEHPIKEKPAENINNNQQGNGADKALNQDTSREIDKHAINRGNKDVQETIKDGMKTGQEEDIYSGYYNTNEKVKKVLLVTYQRSGSSFVGELLTSGGGAMYVYEPLFLWRNILGPEATADVEERAAKALGDLLDCKPEVIHAWRRRPYQYFRRKPQGVRDWCRDANLRLLKTIRARASFVLPWARARQDIKVVHLVRDPRGILNSVRRGGNLWSENNRNAALQCANIERDLQLQELGPGRYLRVRYEDLVESPLEETRRVFGFMGADFDDDVMSYLREHTWLAEKIPAEKQGYLKTFRDSNFQHDHWKTNMDNREIEFIENVCKSVMRKLNYHPLPPT
ncbi:carbohydrate sulfotransferase 1-like [Penaeus japonicus]|uniref:carbohydrate sulfotransferase 1-like n=1 Tax=Penaeus japonicus TaxID=27405 RepID=UPI001C70E3D5|nr:carbohydrate sulfotransferase 1-like [Penaeus japonicus]